MSSWSTFVVAQVISSLSLLVEELRLVLIHDLLVSIILLVVVGLLGLRIVQEILNIFEAQGLRDAISDRVF